ncbi:MAG: 6-bladed beta-propeller [Gemmatimonadetes bacterium]|nr:6-bladed beta-propeller [Gemmatimonadota bacterium]
MTRPAGLLSTLVACTSLIAVTACQTDSQDDADPPSSAVAYDNRQPEYPECQLMFTEELRLGTLEEPSEQAFLRLISLAVAGDGRMFLLDAPDGLVSVFADNGDYLRSFGGLGEGPGQLANPTRIALGADRIFLVDMPRLVAYDTLGEALLQAPLGFRPQGPSFLSADATHLYVTGLDPQGQPTGPIVRLFDHNLESIRAFGYVDAIYNERDALLTSTGRVVPVGDSLWFSPVFDYSLRLLTTSGNLVREVARSHSLPFNPGQFVEERNEGSVSAVGFNMERAFMTGLSVHPSSQRTWVFIRDNIASRIVIDVFDHSGRWLLSSEHSLDAPSHVGSDGRAYRLSEEAGYSQLVRYRIGSQTPSACPHGLSVEADG